MFASSDLYQIIDALRDDTKYWDAEIEILDNAIEHIVQLEAAAAKQSLQCQMDESCKAPVDHIGRKGYIYCQPHAARRTLSATEACRAMDESEIIDVAHNRAITY